MLFEIIYLIHHFYLQVLPSCCRFIKVSSQLKQKHTLYKVSNFLVIVAQFIILCAT
jgi:hypothetical protein